MDTSGIVNVALFALLFLGALIGFAKGFLEQAVELVGAVGAVILAVVMSGALAVWLEDRIDASYSLALVLSFIILLIGGLALTHLVANAVSRAVKMTILRMVDRLTGAALGLITAMLVGSLAISLALELPISMKVRRDVAGASMSLFLRPLAGQIYDFVVDRVSGDKHFEDIFKRGNTV